jgi:hypothetical protein
VTTPRSRPPSADAYCGACADYLDNPESTTASHCGNCACC